MSTEDSPAFSIADYPEDYIAWMEFQMGRSWSEEDRLNHFLLTVQDPHKSWAFRWIRKQTEDISQPQLTWALLKDSFIKAFSPSEASWKQKLDDWEQGSGTSVRAYFQKKRALMHKANPDMDVHDQVESLQKGLHLSFKSFVWRQRYRDVEALYKSLKSIADSVSRAGRSALGKEGALFNALSRAEEEFHIQVSSGENQFLEEKSVDVDEYVSWMESKMDDSWDTSDRILYFRLTLKEPHNFWAYNWVTDHSDEDRTLWEDLSWDEFKEDFIKEFSPIRPILKKRLEECKQGEEESVCAYVERKRALLKKVYPNMTPGEGIKRIEEGLLDSFKKMIRYQRYTDVDELSNGLQRVERLLEYTSVKLDSSSQLPQVEDPKRGQDGEDFKSAKRRKVMEVLGRK